MSSLPRSQVVGAALRRGHAAGRRQPACGSRGRTRRPLDHRARAAPRAPRRACPINLVFVGYQPAAVDVARILGRLPSQGDPTVRENAFWGDPQDVGLRYDYRYRVRFAGKTFDDTFFGYLATSGVAGPIDLFSQFYNEQQHNALDIGPQERYIDAPSTEAWLERQSRLRLGIGAGEDTVFLVNWYGRPDFQFHTFTHFGPPDPDTGVNRADSVGSLTRAWGAVPVRRGSTTCPPIRSMTM